MGAAKRKNKAGKAMFGIMNTVEDDILDHLKDATTPKELWDKLASHFLKKNDARPQILERELMTTLQKNTTVSQYFTKGI